MDGTGYLDATFVFGSALKALAAAERGDLEGTDVQCVIELVNALDSRIPDPVRDYDVGSSVTMSCEARLS